MSNLQHLSGGNGARARAEYREFIRLLRYALTHMDPLSITTDCVGAIEKMMHARVDAKYDVNPTDNLE